MRLLAVLVLLALPSAQALTVAVDGPTEPLEPGPGYPVLVTVTIDCAELLAHPDPAPRITVAVTAEPFFATGPTDAAVDRQSCVGAQSIDVALEFTVTATMETPAEEPSPVRFTASLVGSDEEATAAAELEAAYVSRFSALVHAPHKQAGPQNTIPFEIEIRNAANARTVFSFTIDKAPEGHVVLPEEIILEPRGGRDRAVAIVTYATPFENGANDVSEPLRVTIHAASLEGTQGNSTTVDLVADTKGFYVPGPGMLVLAALLLAWRRP